ncbi:hypothetical protein K461DRAFT_223364 [Myriangium duriaei CBS 260.36]|uniref:Uncharacterized protein n=1 Tax=Myriangium duriaei CBS 260.36 TaxID=1168546 RepID=A0A9P4MIC4_9PEZI|nr:hypothetical protein K461DRAFT_223364 [Myriangium duriaei CBS 260.36]
MARIRYNPCSYLPRRLQIVVSLTLFVVLSILFFGSSSETYTEGISKGARKAADYVPDNISRQFSDSAFNPFRTPAHEPPPQQANSTSGDISWFSDFNWRHPFSAAVAIDDRALLPAESLRVPVYTYYELDPKKDKPNRQAENDLLLAWRRAWWAKGFRPIILGRAEALRNPLYRSMQSLNLESSLEADLMRWLAWGNMGTGILSNWLAFPMCAYNDDMLKYLRKGEFPHITRFKTLHNGLFVGDGNKINEAIRLALSSQTPPTGESLIDALPKSTFKVETDNEAIAFYSTDVLQHKYKDLYEILTQNSAKGKVTLRKLIESHLQATWQGTFTEGIAVLRPIPESMTAVSSQALHLAQNLSACLDNPYPQTCPPNKGGCRTCLPNHPMTVNYAKSYINDSKIFSIGTVPHPYTLSSLARKSLIDSAKVIRRETKRDPYIIAVSSHDLGAGRSSYSRLVFMKDSVASEMGMAHSLWMIAERKFDKAWREDLTWVFGFPIPHERVEDGMWDDGPVPGPERKIKEEDKEWVPAKMPDEKGVKLEHKLLEDSKLVVVTKRDTKANKRMKEVTEKWSLADAELWNFVRAFAARRRVEREKWEEEEMRFAGSDNRGKWNRWFGEDET